jgi:thiol-disulfide isomerase/thioredoxin
MAMTKLTRRSAAAGLLTAAMLPARSHAAPSIYQWEPVQKQPQPISFMDRRGATVDLSHYLGHPILLNLWATWCGPCILELPALSRLQRDLSKTGLIVLALSVDRGGMPDVLEAHRRLHLAPLAPLVNVAGDALRTLSVVGLPTTFAIDALGKFVARRRGAVEWDLREERAKLTSLLSDQHALARGRSEA